MPYLFFLFVLIFSGYMGTGLLVLFLSPNPRFQSDRLVIPEACVPSFSCGHQIYEFSCIGNKTFLKAPYDNYLVKDFQYLWMTVVDTELAEGKCSLPFQALTPSFLPNDFFLDSDMYYWVAFINCSKEVEPSLGEVPFALIPCLSQNNRSIYVVEGTRMDSLLPSCTYLTMAPISIHVNLSALGDDVFQTLKHEFFLQRTDARKTESLFIVGECISEALGKAVDSLKGKNKIWGVKYSFLFVYEVLNCIYKNGDVALYTYFISNIMFIGFIFYTVYITIGRLIIAPLCIHVFLLYKLWKMLAPMDSIEIFLRNQQSATPTRYAYIDIVAMTSHFKDRLGQGGFGTVYKGELPGGHLLAIKLLGKSTDNGEDFISEVSTIGMIHHTNIVRLVGFCSEGLHRALVYEYMHNGSLDKYIFSSTQKFTGEKLIEIAIGVARGIDYLHRGCDMRILHFDIKPNNILLDNNFNPKVSDFGLAKLYPKDYSMVSAFAARGTIGCMAPELISRSFGIISYKSDVYSFGMLLLEMAGGRRNFDSRVENSSQAYYPSWIYDRLKQQTSTIEGVNHNIEIEIEIEEIERKLCKVGLWCIQMAPSSRPTMMRVLEMLEGDVDDVEIPPKPFFFSSSSQQTTRGQNSYELSFNEISTIYESE